MEFELWGDDSFDQYPSKISWQILIKERNL